jgi:hypothetical protein
MVDRPPPPDSARPPPPGPGRSYWGSPSSGTYPGRPYPGYYGYYPSPYWWGYGWGWGYEPLYPIYPERRTFHDPGAPAPARLLGATLRATAGTGSNDGGVVGLAFAVDGRHGGFDLAVDAFSPSRGGVMSGGLGGTQDAYGLGSAHVAFPILEAAAFRLKLLAGGSWLTVPATTAGSSVDAFGFDFGVSGTLGLVGPIGLEGHARITPYPVQVVDLRAAVALRAGPFSVLGGYRVIDLAADSKTGPAARFEGPEFGLGVIF